MSEVESLTLRPATADDTPRLVALQSGAASGWNIASYERELSLSFSRVRVLESPQRNVIGAMVYWVVADEIQLLNIAVDPTHRRAGHGRHMLDALLHQAKAGGQTKITLEVRRDNRAALALYSDLEFRTVGVRPQYYADGGVDAILMERDV
jgi:ribosomal-protein-alanine N-acetyltransferase